MIHFVGAGPGAPDLITLRGAELLKQAYAHLAAHPAAVTDDASVVELMGHKVATALGRYENIKITTPEDLLFAENLLAQQEQEDGK